VTRPGARAAAAAGLVAVLVVPTAGTEAQDLAPLPSLNLSGVPGLIDMPSGEAQPDGELNVGLSRFGNFTRTSLSFQILPRISGSFRYIATRDLNFGGFEDYYDRAFDARILLLREREGRPWPSVTLGFQDFIGTGVYSSEYLVATKTLPRGVKVTGGLGWGRLGSLGEIGSPFGDRPPIDVGLGGNIDPDVFFRGPAAPFGGVEWQATERLGFKLEYSSDAYEFEEDALDRRSPINAGVEYRFDDSIRLGAYYLYGSEVGASVQFALNPRRPPNAGSIEGAPPPVLRRPAPGPGGHPTGWTGEAATDTLREALTEALLAEGIRLEALAVSADAVEVRIFPFRLDAPAQAVGRTARVLSRLMPASVETFRIVPASNDMPLAAVTVPRSDLEEAVIEARGTEALLAATEIEGAPPARRSEAEVRPDLYPRFGVDLGPYVRLSYFDPDEPLRYELGARLSGFVEPAPGLVASGSVTKRVVSTLDDIEREGRSELPPVRTNIAEYAREGDPALERLTGAYYFKPTEDLYARVSAGYLERMFGGLSTELLWKPVESRLAFGVEVNYARQRDFDQLLGFQDYDVVTGHASAYYQFDNGFQAQVDAGRYLAGDWGATFRLARTFSNGWSAGGYFTVTDVTAEEFGEGSFDKGISVSIPVSWITGRPTQRQVGTSIQSLTRDGGAFLSVGGRLYGQVAPYHEQGLEWRGGRILR
jgi:hypothetical protein